MVIFAGRASGRVFVPGLLLLSVLLGLSGCSADGPGITASLCSQYEQNWSIYAGVRSDPQSTAADLIAARNTLTKGWSEFSSSADISDEIKETVVLVSQNFTAAYNGDKSAQPSFWNGQDLVAARCSETGVTIAFTDRNAPIAPPR